MYALTLHDWNTWIADAIHKKHSLLIAGANMHFAYVGRKDSEIQEMCRSALSHIDGMALIFLGRLLGYPLKREHRVTWVDWMDPLMGRAAREGWRVFFLGGKPGVGEVAAERLRQAQPGLRIQVHHGFFDQRAGSEGNERVLTEITEAEPDLLLVGLGMPRQEHWIWRNRARLPATVIITCGAAMDYVAGEIPTPPRWMGRWGLEWLYRFLCEPHRLFKRYFVEPWFLIIPFMNDLKRVYWDRRDRNGKE